MLHDKPGAPSASAAGPPTPPEPARGGARDAALDLGCLLLLLISALSCAWIADDAFISLRVVENAADGFGLRWNTDERVLVFSHPLWLLLHLPQIHPSMAMPQHQPTLRLRLMLRHQPMLLPTLPTRSPPTILLPMLSTMA